MNERSAPRRPSPVLAIAGFAATVVFLTVAIVIARPAEAADDLSILSSVILGLVEGLTEYLPVSSTGHLLVVQQLLGLGGTEASDLALDTYAICIQAGAILAVLVLYRRRLVQMLAGVRGNDPAGRRLFAATLSAFLPTVVIALALGDLIRDRLFDVVPIAIAWIAGGFAIFVLVRTGRIQRSAGRDITDLGVRHAAIIGTAQAIALWPGVSRSLVTIVAAVLVGLSLHAAVEFSFILGLATLSAATAYEALNNGANLIDQFGLVSPIVGLVVAFASAVVAIRWMVGWLESRGFGFFGGYRIAVGVGTLVALGFDLVG